MGNSQGLRTALSKYLKQNSGKAVGSIKSSGVQLSPQEEQSLKSGNLESFSDQQLTERFNPKVLGILGINLEGQQSQGKQGESKQGMQEHGEQGQRSGGSKP